MACEVFKIVNKLSPEYIEHLINIKISPYNFRGERKADLPRVNTTKYGLRSFRSEAPRVWNSLSNNLRMAESYPLFRKAAPEMGWPWMWMPSVLCLALFFRFDFALLFYFCVYFNLKSYPLLHTCALKIAFKQDVLLRQVLFSRLFVFKVPACFTMG